MSASSSGFIRGEALGDDPAVLLFGERVVNRLPRSIEEEEQGGLSLPAAERSGNSGSLNKPSSRRVILSSQVRVRRCLSLSSAVGFPRRMRSFSQLRNVRQVARHSSSSLAVENKGACSWGLATGSLTTAFGILTPKMCHHCSSVARAINQSFGKAKG